MNIFSESKYTEASKKCIDFIKRQFNVNNFEYSLTFGQEYANDYIGDVVWGTVEGISQDEDQVRSQYIAVPEYYDYDYTGKVQGTWSGISDYENYAVNVYVIRDAAYKVITCPLKADGTWESSITYRETYSENEISTYDLDINVGVGIKEFRLARNVSSTWENISQSSTLIADRQIYNATDEIAPKDGGSPYAYFKYFTVRLYSFSDTEYLNDSCTLWNVGGGKYIWYTNKVNSGHKIAKIMQQVWREDAVAYDVVGISGAISNITKGRLPASVLIPTNDPQYDKDGSTANGAYGYLLNSRTWAYDVGLALLVFTTSKDYDICKEMLNRMKFEQNDDGSFNFSYDIYIGQLFEGYVRTGAIGWLVWGACYYTIESGDRSYIDMIERAGNWMLSQQIIDESDNRYGFMTGGYGSYNMNDYSYNDVPIDWCSVEHQCSGLQALEGCALVLNDTKYKKAAELVRKQLFLKCYDSTNKRFYQGISKNSHDSAWALDCTTWAGSLIFSVVNDDTAKACLNTAKEVYGIDNIKIVQSSDDGHYNMTYSSDDTFSGFKPYSDKTADYAGAPNIIWAEGTLGYAALALMVGNTEEAKKYVDECIKLQNCNGSTGGVINVNATYGMLPWEFHVWESVVSSAWLYLVINNPDVLFPKTLRQVSYMARMQNVKDERH